MPFKANAVLSWRHPNMVTGINEPLAYIISNTSMYKFNFWNYPTENDAIDVRYFLFDCVKTNSMPDSDVFLGPSYKQAFIENDVYRVVSDEVAVKAPFESRLLNDKMRRHDGLVQVEDKIVIDRLESKAREMKSENILLPIVFVMICYLLNL
jgi:hypothetical protein